MNFSHTPVLLQACMNGLNLRDGLTYVDGTIGGGGHAEAILSHISGGSLIGIDRDADALSAVRARITDPRLKLIHGNFHDISAILDDLTVDGILLDLGVSSYQLDETARGFSYHGAGALDMRMDQTQTLTARDIVNEWPESSVAQILRDFGEENWSAHIAKIICDRRIRQSIDTADQLVDIIDAAIPKKFRGQDGSHPARRTFQALRIAVNDELTPLEDALFYAINCINPTGRLCVITFHSLEDRIVKNAFRRMANPCTCPPKSPYCICGKRPIAKIITRKPMVADAEELRNNPRSRSAGLRIVERI